MNIDPSTGGTLSTGRSSRFKLWLTFFAISTIVMSSAIAVVSKYIASNCEAQAIQYLKFIFSFASKRLLFPPIYRNVSIRQLETKLPLSFLFNLVISFFLSVEKC